MWSDLELSFFIYCKKLKNYLDTKDHILLGTSQAETPGAVFAEAKWMLLAPNVFAWHFCLTPSLSIICKSTTFLLAKPLFSFGHWIDGCEYICIFCPSIKKSPWSSSDIRIDWWFFILAKLGCLKKVCLFS